MHLTSKQVFLLLIPFFFSGIVYIFDMDIVENIRYVFPTYQEYTNKSLNKKATIYLQIEAKDTLYQEIQNNIQARRQNAAWLVNTVLYKKLPKNLKIQNPYLQSIQNVNKIKKKRNIFDTLHLQAVFSKDKVAIINGKILKEGSRFRGFRILKIENEKVLLVSKKGKKWLYLFQ